MAAITWSPWCLAHPAVNITHPLGNVPFVNIDFWKIDTRCWRSDLLCSSHSTVLSRFPVSFYDIWKLAYKWRTSWRHPQHGIAHVSWTLPARWNVKASWGSLTAWRDNIPIKATAYNCLGAASSLNHTTCTTWSILSRWHGFFDMIAHWLWCLCTTARSVGALAFVRR